jgi:quinol-cytochrome oxidoreductase complex cytochrome b subunit
MFTKQVTNSKAYQWFNERLEVQAIADDISSKYVPPHVNIFYCLGGITLTCFVIQFATGFAMTFYYKPTVTEAFSSVQYLMTDVNFGWSQVPFLWWARPLLSSCAVVKRLVKPPSPVSIACIPLCCPGRSRCLCCSTS